MLLVYGLGALLADYCFPPFLLADLPDVEAPLDPTHPKINPEEIVFPFFRLKLDQFNILDVARWREDMFSGADASLV